MIEEINNKENNFHKNENIYLCTDFPEEANIYFK